MKKEFRFESDAQLMAALKNGNEQALTLVYDRFWQKMYLAAWNIIKDRNICEDIVQDIFVKLWIKRADIEITTSLSGYLLTATRNQVFQVLKRTALQDEVWMRFAQRVYETMPDQQLEYKLLQEKITVAVNELPEKCKEIFIVSREHNLSYKSIARLMGVSPKTVENHISVALKRIRRALTILLFLLFSM